LVPQIVKKQDAGMRAEIDEEGDGEMPGLLGTASEEGKSRAEAEAIDAELERGAAAAKESLEKGFEFEGAGNVLFDFGELADGEFFPAGADWGVVAEAGEEKLDFGEGEAHVGGEADEEDAMEGVAGVAALAAGPLGRGKEAQFFVVADGGGVEVGAGGELADFHDGLPEIQLDLKLTLTSSIEGWDVANPIWRKANAKQEGRVGKNKQGEGRSGREDGKDGGRSVGTADC
jgi:hypothetical protein